MTDISDARTVASADAHGLQGQPAAGVMWHGVWLLIVLAVAAALLVAEGDLPFQRGLALGLGAIPGALGGLWGRGASRRPLMLIWAVCAALALGFAGGVTGPLLPWSALPLLVAAVVGGLWLDGVVLSLAVVVVVGVVQLLGLLPVADNDAWTALLASGGALGSTAAWLMLSGGSTSEAAARYDSARFASAGGALAETLGAGPVEPEPPLQPDPSAATEMAEPPPIRPLHAAFNPEERLRRIEQAEKGLRDQLRASFEARAQLEAERDVAFADRDRAEANARARLRFLANMSHELRTPLNAIMGFSDIMRARLFGELAPKYGEYAQLIHESGGHVLDLINDLLDMAKIESDKYELRREIFDVREAINAALRILRVQADDAGVQLRAELPADEVAVDADPRAIKQIVLNLVSNSLKFTPPGGSVLLTAEPRNESLELVVADTGSGIAPEDIDRLGRPFEQAGDVKDRQRGTGLGLSLVKAFAGLHGGELMIESILGEGTVVRVRLPVLHRDSAASALPGLHGRAD